jgi:hypothetical protein
MSVTVDPCASPPSGTLSCYVTTAAAVAAAITFSASGAAPTPLYHEYQEHFDLTAFSPSRSCGAGARSHVSMKFRTQIGGI